MAAQIAVAAGARMPLFLAIGLRLAAERAVVPPRLRDAGVTAREVEVLALVARRCTNVEIAGRLYLSPRTVEKHIASLLAKTGAPSRAELARLAADSDPAGEHGG